MFLYENEKIITKIVWLRWEKLRNSIYDYGGGGDKSFELSKLDEKCKKEKWRCRLGFDFSHGDTVQEVYLIFCDVQIGDISVFLRHPIQLHTLNF